MLHVNSTDTTKCVNDGCMAVPILIWVGLNVAAVCIASILVAYGEVSVEMA